MVMDLWFDFNRRRLLFKLFPSFELPKKPPSQLYPPNLPEKTSQVLGEKTFFLKEWFQNITLETWIILGISLTLLFIFTIALQLILTSWAKGALISGLTQAQKEENPNLLTTSPKGIAAIKNLVLLRLISLGIYFCLIFISAIFLLLTIILIKSTAGNLLITLFLAILAIFAVLFFITASIFLSMVNIYAERLVVFYSFSPWQAWKKGFNLSKSKFLPTFLMGIINQGVEIGGGCLTILLLLILLVIPGFILLKDLLNNSFNHPPFFAIGIFLLFFLFWLGIVFLIRTIITLLKFSNWNLLFEEIIKNEENGK
jgi:hypothetical protein